MKRHRLPTLVIMTCLVLVAAGLYLADRAGYRADPRDSSYAAPDGAAWYANRRTPSGEQRVVVESARSTGAVAVQALIPQLAQRALRPFGDAALARMRIWRVISTAADSGEQSTEVFRIDQGIERLAEPGERGSDRDQPRVFTPALPELPNGVAAGSRWQASGDAGDRLDYQASFEAAAAGADCLLVTGTITYRAAGTTGSASVEQTRRRWCKRGDTVGLAEEWRQVRRPGQAEEVTHTHRLGAVGSGAGVALRTDSASYRGAAPTAWERRPARSVAGPGAARDDAVTPPTDIPAFVAPVADREDRLVRAVIPGNDLLIFRRSTEGRSEQWSVSARMHPGGQVVMLTTIGDLVLVGTTDRRLVGYNAQGYRLWVRDLPDPVRDPPVRTDDDHLAVVTTSGSLLLLEVSSGRPVWQQSVGADVEAPLVGGPTVIMVADRTGRLTSYDARSGVVRWQRDDAAGDHGRLIGDRLVQAEGSEVVARSLTTGEQAWRITLGSRVTAIAPVVESDRTVGTGDAVLAASAAGSRSIRLDGTVLEHRSGYQNLLSGVGPNLIGIRQEGVDVLDPSGRSIRRIDVPTPTTLTQLRWTVPTSRGLLLLTAPEWDFQVLR